MSELRVNDIVSENGGNAVGFSKGINISSGVVTATTFKGNVEATTLSGTFSGDTQVGGALTVAGNFTVQGTQTIVNVETFDVQDKTVGIASTTTASDATADGAGIEIYASSSVADNNKTLTWERDTGCFTVNNPFKFKGVVETVSAASTHETGDAGNYVLQMDLSAGTIFTYDMLASGNIGVVSFRNMPADTGVKNAQTVTLITTQSSTTPSGFGNTTAATGIGTYCRITGFEDGAVVAFANTAGKVATASTVTLSATTGDVDITSFLIDYNGGTNTTNTSYKVYVTSAGGGFRFGNVGI